MAGTTSSSGLNSALASTNQVQTTLPSWYDQAQQNVVSNAGAALGQTPTFGQTTAQGAVNTLQGGANPFSQAQSTLNTISSGAANPWIVNPQTGAVTPNTQTAMGGLFSAQQNQLNQLLPTQIAPTEAGAIGTGNFGSLRGQTAVDTAKTNALATLQAQQMQAALQNQQTGATAANALGNVGAQGITAGLTTGAAQMNAPFQGLTNYANLVNSVNVPGTVSQQNQMSPLAMLGSLSQIPNAGTGLLNSIFGTPAQGVAGTSGYIPASGGLLDALQRGFGSGSSNVTNVTGTGGVGTMLDTNGNVVTDPTYGIGAPTMPVQPGGDTGAFESNYPTTSG
jgi:hypothetical protein